MKNINRIVTVLELISTYAEGVGITELHKSSSLPKSTLHRILNSLIKYGYAAQSKDTKKYKLGPTFLRLSANYLHQNDLRKIATPYLKKLNQEFMETVYLVVFQNNLAICIDTHELSRNNVTYFVKQGRVLPFNTCAAAKVILAYQEEEIINELVVQKNIIKSTEKSITDPKILLKHLSKIRKIGYALCKEEMEEGVMAIAAPIWDINLKVVGSVAIVGPLNRIENLEKKLIKNIKKTAYSISCEMGCNPELFGF